MDRGDPHTASGAMAHGFRVPLGVAPDGALARAGEALAGTGYRCPGRSGPLVLRKGEVRAAHFAHHQSST